TFNYLYNADNTLRSATNPLGHRTNYAYDVNSNVTEIDQLAETSAPVTTTFSYELAHNQLTAVTDPLGHAATLTVDGSGNTTQVTDASGGDSFTYNADGTLATATDGMGNSTQFGYSDG